MGLLSSIASIAAPIAGTIFGGPVGGAIGGAVGGLLGGKSQPSNLTTNQSGTQTGTTSTTLNPAIAQMIGLNGSGGVLGGLANSMGQHNLLSDVGKDFNNANAQTMLYDALGGTTSLLKNPYQFPTIGAAQIDAPSQNNIDLTPTFNSLLSGGNNQALRDSLSYGTQLTGAQFQKNQTDLTNNLMRNVLPSLRSNSVLAGQYGGSRQGIAEGNALSDYTNQLTNANTQLGLANSANTTGQLANDYQMGQNRALSAAQGLSAQQYATAAADAAARQAADNTNVNSLLNTNALNSSNKIAGVGLQQGLINSAGNYANSDLTRLGATAGILAPFMGAGATTNTTNNTTGNVSQPLYQNTAGNMLGGAMLGGQMSGLLGSLSGGSSSLYNTPSSIGGYTPATSMQVPSLPFLSSI
ncbi:hypothetical protein SAMN05428966_10247 [Massilia sp. PDC64]|nr:hypothetical protein [Massilia sp. PDC64]SDC65267.1 hypothetical protein SAMN05428966_10247 [Massilia sp. PDC64]